LRSRVSRKNGEKKNRPAGRGTIFVRQGNEKMLGCFCKIPFMARHSHWHNIQLKKGKTDGKKANVFAKIVKTITVAAKEGGGDPAFNVKLRVAIDAAKAISMPKENIERAVARGTGQEGGNALEEVTYEGFGPGGVALLVVCVTDNHNRTVADVKMIASKKGGIIGAAGSVMWMFEKKGVVTFAEGGVFGDREKFDLIMIETGAEDLLPVGEDGVQVVCDPRDLKHMMDTIESLGLKPDGVGMEYVAKTTTEISDPAVQEKFDALVEALEENDDVDAVYTNQA